MYNRVPASYRDQNAVLVYEVRIGNIPQPVKILSVARHISLKNQVVEFETSLARFALQLPHLRGGDALQFRDFCARDIAAFVGDKPEFWAYFADYDWVALCQLYGRMIDLPEGWPMFCLDLKQSMHERGISRDALPKNEGAHDALADARWTAAAWRRVMA